METGRWKTVQLDKQEMDICAYDELSRAVMFHLMCVGYVALSAPFSDSLQAAVPKKQRSSVVQVHSHREVIPQNSQHWQRFKKVYSSEPACIYFW